MSLNGKRQKGSPSLTVALVGIVLAVVVMILSIAIVMGFKGEISGKIMHLDAHLRVTNAALGIDDNYATVNGREVREAIAENGTFDPLIESISLVADKSASWASSCEALTRVMTGATSSPRW